MKQAVQHFTHTTASTMRRVGAGALLTVAVLVTLFVAEGLPLRFATEQGEAFFGGNNKATLTLESNSFVWAGPPALSHYTITYCDGTTGAKVEGAWSDTVTIHSDKEIKSVTAKGGLSTITTHRSCSTATVDPDPVPPTYPACPPVSVSIDDTEFTWAGCPRMERYSVTFCDGTTAGPVYGEWDQDTTVEFDKRIKTVQACGSNCHKLVEQSCPPTPVAPEYPSCPFTANSNTTVITFDEQKLLSSGTEAQAQTRAYAVTLPAGTYTVQTASWDGYLGRTEISQPNESWVAVLSNSGNTIATTARTSDLADYVVESFKQETVNQSLVLATPVDSLIAKHAFYPDTTSYNSVHPICIAFTKQSVTPSGPTCDMQASPSSIVRGKTATISWTSTNTTSASFDQGISATTTSGSFEVKPTTTTTYTGTFTATDGKTVSCNTTVRVTSSGGGGKCINCDDDDDKETTVKKDKEEESDPTFVLGKTITRTGGSITLDQVPYTGFEAGPFTTALFWFGVLVASILIVHFGSKAQLMSHLSTRLAELQPQTTPRSYVRPTLYDDVYAPTATLYTAPSNTVGASTQAGAVDHSSIEDRAHADNILLSPESVQTLTNTIQEQKLNADSFLRELFNNAIASYPREDGWILLSQERTLSLIAKTSTTPARAPEMAREVVTPQASQPTQVRTEQQTERVRTEGAEDTGTLAPLFIDLLVAGEQQKSFELLRRLLAKGVTLESFITTVVRKLDDVYKNRLEGNHNPDKELATKTALWSNADFEKVLGLLVECIDYSYSNNRIGTKIAMTKIFEHFSTAGK
jgi:hypothetical protein